MMDRNNKAKRYLGLYLLLPVILELIIESLNRKSFISGVLYMIQSPLLFFFNTLIIMLTLSIAMFFKREIFVLISVSIVWLIFGIANFVILHFRVTPFSAVDFTLIQSAIRVSGHYLNVLNIAMIILAAVLILIGMVCLFRKAPRHHAKSHKRIFFSAVSVVSLAVMIFVIRNSSSSVQALSTNYTNISEAYENYGFVYCFTNSILDTGIAKPDNYSEESVDQVLSSLTEKEDIRGEKPNIIMIQLESFFDVNYVKGLSFSKDPLPVFHRLEREYSSGLLTVPTVGAGTVNTEFEVLTGMRQRDFGVSEYPYKTVLKSTPAESICTNLEKLGYHSHAVHNNEATFYGRNKVFANLGFDTFTSMEYMNGLTENPNGWSNDDILAREIIKTLDSTDGSDLTVGITVQSHGKYDGIEMTEEQNIKVSGAPEGMESSYQYYINELYEVDQMIGDLIKRLEKRDEKSVLVLYGDHLPSLGLEKEDLTNGSLYQTQYVVWDNMGLEKKAQNLYSYQLYSEVLDRIGIHQGNITKYHQQTNWNSPEYENGLTMLSYDALYGDNYAYGGISPYQTKELRMGTDRVQINNVKKNRNGYVLTGTGFTPYMHVYYNGSELDIMWKNSNSIQILEELEYDPEKEDYNPLEVESPEDIPNAFVVEVQSEDGVELSMSDALRWKDTSLAGE